MSPSQVLVGFSYVSPKVWGFGILHFFRFSPGNLIFICNSELWEYSINKMTRMQGTEFNLWQLYFTRKQNYVEK